jgi:hypothetical protein
MKSWQKKNVEWFEHNRFFTFFIDAHGVCPKPRFLSAMAPVRLHCGHP